MHTFGCSCVQQMQLILATGNGMHERAGLSILVAKAQAQAQVRVRVRVKVKVKVFHMHFISKVKVCVRACVRACVCVKPNMHVQTQVPKT